MSREIHKSMERVWEAGLGLIFTWSIFLSNKYVCFYFNALLCLFESMHCLSASLMFFLSICLSMSICLSSSLFLSPSFSPSPSPPSLYLHMLIVHSLQIIREALFLREHSFICPKTRYQLVQARKPRCRLMSIPFAK